MVDIGQFAPSFRAELLRTFLAPDPDVRVEKASHCTSQSFSMSEWIMSPLISIQPLSAPSRTRFFGFTIGSTRTIGSPRSVTTIGSLVFCTFFNNPMHLALNSETKTVFIEELQLGQQTRSTLPPAR